MTITSRYTPSDNSLLASHNQAQIESSVKIRLKWWFSREDVECPHLPMAAQGFTIWIQPTRIRFNHKNLIELFQVERPNWSRERRDATCGQIIEMNVYSGEDAARRAESADGSPRHRRNGQFGDVGVGPSPPHRGEHRQLRTLLERHFLQRNCALCFIFLLLPLPPLKNPRIPERNGLTEIYAGRVSDYDDEGWPPWELYHSLD